MQNPYNNKDLIYILTEKELSLIDEVWILINIFNNTELTRNKYRKIIINIIKNRYTIEKFYELEIIIEKMYWNLVNKIKLYFFVNNKIKSKETNNIEKIKNKILIKNKNITLSNIRKSYICENNKILYKYDYPNELDMISTSIMINRSIYETIMININIYEFIEPYNNMEFDYPFPNLNTIKPFSFNEETRFENIKKMYYDDDCEKNWFI
jgi:hypothetical protein